LFILSTQSRLGSRVSVLYILSLLPVSNDFYDKSKVYANKWNWSRVCKFLCV
jgi:hypothetical protein